MVRLDQQMSNERSLEALEIEKKEFRTKALANMMATSYAGRGVQTLTMCAPQKVAMKMDNVEKKSEKDKIEPRAERNDEVKKSNIHEDEYTDEDDDWPDFGIGEVIEVDSEDEREAVGYVRECIDVESDDEQEVVAYVRRAKRVIKEDDDKDSEINHIKVNESDESKNVFFKGKMDGIFKFGEKVQYGKKDQKDQEGLGAEIRHQEMQTSSTERQTT